MRDVSATPRRTQDRRTEQPMAPHGKPFANEPDTDWSLPANQAWINSVLADWRTRRPEQIPLQLNGTYIESAVQASGCDPSRPGVVAYRYAQADRAQVTKALEVAVRAQVAWGARPVAERRAQLLEASAQLSRGRGELVGAMIVDSAKAIPEADAEVSEAIDFARTPRTCPATWRRADCGCSHWAWYRGGPAHGISLDSGWWRAGGTHGWNMRF